MWGAPIIIIFFDGCFWYHKFKIKIKIGQSQNRYVVNSVGWFFKNKVKTILVFKLVLMLNIVNYQWISIFGQTIGHFGFH
jgi:hypothetical protein